MQLKCIRLNVALTHEIKLHRDHEIEKNVRTDTQKENQIDKNDRKRTATTKNLKCLLKF